ncbi:MAG: DUF4292 domain-containing protein [Oscillibacter sp.]|nr:DUF4292 domain-containing protein [Oscillibacter sp.]
MKIYRIVVWVLICFSVVSCRTIKQVVVKKDVPVITENKLFKNIENNELDYHTLFAKRIDISLTSEKKNNSFKASLKIQRDSFIQISMTAPLGIEVARILLTKDSVKFVDMYHKKYFLSDYTYFYNKYDAYITYDFLQNLLTNTFFNPDFYGTVNKNKKYKLDRVDNGYELSTVEERALSRKIKKLYKKRRKNKDFILILQKILIDPQLFRPLSVSVEDVEEGIGVSVNYKNFNDFSGKIFPEIISFGLFSEHTETKLELKFQKIEFDVPIESNLKILPKYKRIE